MPELRVEIPDAVAAVLDAYASAGKRPRSEVVNEILLDWAKKRHHEATLILRVAGGDPSWPEPDRK